MYNVINVDCFCINWSNARGEGRLVAVTFYLSQWLIEPKKSAIKMAKFGVLGLLPSKIPKPFLIALNTMVSLFMFAFFSFDWDTRTTILIQIWFVTFGCACCMLKTRRIVTRCFLQCVDFVETTFEMASIETKRAILICQNERKEKAEADGEKRIFDKCQRKKKKNKTLRRRKKIVNDLFRRRTCLMKNPFYNCTWPEKKIHTKSI